MIAMYLTAQCLKNVGLTLWSAFMCFVLRSEATTALLNGINILVCVTETAFVFREVEIKLSFSEGLSSGI
jgi:hypothetical protein